MLLARALPPSPSAFDEEELAAIRLGRRAERDEILVQLSREIRRLELLEDLRHTPRRRSFVRGMREALKRMRKHIIARRGRR